MSDNEPTETTLTDLFCVDQDIEPPSEGAYGECHSHQGAKRAWIRLSDHNGDMHELRNTVIHELLHCHWNEANKLVEQSAIATLGPQAAEVMRVAWKTVMELGIDGIASAWDACLPLPSECLESETNPDKEAA